MKKILPLLFLGVLLLTGCNAHVDTTGQAIEGTKTCTFDSIQFVVPDIESIDYSTIVSQTYTNAEDQDAARIRLINETISGTSENGYLLTRAHEFIFYVAKSEGTIDLMNSKQPRDDMLALVSRADVDFVNYGRYVANTDVTPKATLRVDFRIEGALGESVSYSGYLGVANLNGNWYYYLAGYNSATDKDLTQCFNCVRSLS